LKNKILFYLLSLSLILFLFNACYLEKKYGFQFIQNNKNISILLLEPDLFLISNIKKQNNSDTDSISIIGDLNQTALTHQFMSELTQELNSYGLSVFCASKIDTFFLLLPPAYLFNIAQIELEEFIYPFKERYTTDSIIYTQEFLLNAVNLNTWFEFSELNSEKKPEVLFSNFYIKDDIDGDFKVNLLTDDVSYVYFRNDIKKEDINTLIKYAAKNNATYIYNHLLNNYIKEKIGDKFNERYFYYYDLKKNKIYFLENYSEFKKINK